MEKYKVIIKWKVEKTKGEFYYCYTFKNVENISIVYDLVDNLKIIDKTIMIKKIVKIVVYREEIKDSNEYLYYNTYE